MNAAGTTLMVTDPVNDRISTYAFPSGTQLTSAKLKVKAKGGTIVPISMMSYPNNK